MKYDLDSIAAMKYDLDLITAMKYDLDLIAVMKYDFPNNNNHSIIRIIARGIQYSS